MSIAALVAPINRRTSWFTPQGAANKPKPVVASDFRLHRGSVASGPRGGEKPTLKDPIKGKDSVDSSTDGASLTAYGQPLRVLGSQQYLTHDP
jgi:hypothetical protein